MNNNLKNKKSFYYQIRSFRRLTFKLMITLDKNIKNKTLIQ